MPAAAHSTAAAAEPAALFDVFADLPGAVAPGAAATAGADDKRERAVDAR